jgi:tagatose 1,6-diphosphate aldolase
MKISQGKYRGIQACANSKGVIAAAAMDQRGSLRKALARARGGEFSDQELSEFKTLVSRILSPHASALLLDVEYGQSALEAKAPGVGVLLAYEKSGYDAQDIHRMPDLLPEWSVRRLVEAGANAIKVLLYYSPADPDRINRIKGAFLERVGAECQALDVPFFLEPIVYHPGIEENSLEFARLKPSYVARAMEEFSKERYGVDILKVEFPFQIQRVEGTQAFEGEAAYTRAQALEHLRVAASAAGKPFIYLSAGVSDQAFRESLELAGEAGVAFAGVLCGRATWQGGIPVYAKEGRKALEEWLKGPGVENITRLNEVLDRLATPWYRCAGGVEVAG